MSNQKPTPESSTIQTISEPSMTVPACWHPQARMDEIDSLCDFIKRMNNAGAVSLAWYEASQLRHLLAKSVAERVDWAGEVLREEG